MAMSASAAMYTTRLIKSFSVSYLGSTEAQLAYAYVRVGGSYRILCEQLIGLGICLQFRRDLPCTPESPVGRTKTVRKSPTKSASTTMESNPKGSSHSSSTGNPGNPIVRLITYPAKAPTETRAPKPQPQLRSRWMPSAAKIAPKNTVVSSLMKLCISLTLSFRIAFENVGLNAWFASLDLVFTSESKGSPGAVTLWDASQTTGHTDRYEGPGMASMGSTSEPHEGQWNIPSGRWRISG
jgi:hypothetical protein